MTKKKSTQTNQAGTEGAAADTTPSGADVVKVQSDATPETRPIDHAKQMEELINGLTESYCAKESKSWPIDDELNKVTELMAKVGKDMGVKKTELGHWGALYKRIEQRHKKIGLGLFAQKLLARVIALPTPPMTRIAHLIEKCEGASERKKALTEIQERLKKYDWPLNLSEKFWSTHAELLQELAGKPLAELVQGCKVAQWGEIDTKETRQAYAPLIGLATFLELQRQHLLWLLQNERQIAPTVQWLYGFLIEDWDKKLRQKLHGTAATPEIFAKHSATFKDSQRKKRYRSRKAKLA